MTVNELLRDVQDHGAVVWADGERLELEIPEDFPDNLINAVKEHKTKILASHN